MTAALQSSAHAPVRLRLGVARALLDCRRFDDAERVVRDVQSQASSGVDRGNAEHIRGVLAEYASDQAAALAAYEAAVAADPERWDACCNAVTLLLERDDPKSLARAGQLLDRISPELKTGRPQLRFNEAVYLRRIGRITEARAAAERVAAAAPNTELAELAHQLLEETSDELDAR